MSKKVVVVRKTAVKKTPVFKGVPVGVPVNLLLDGERTMRKSVVLRPHATNKSLLTIHTGRRGRPSHVLPSQIKKVRAL